MSGLTDERTRHPQTSLPVTRFPAHRPYRALAQPLLSLSDSYTVRCPLLLSVHSPQLREEWAGNECDPQEEVIEGLYHRCYHPWALGRCQSEPLSAHPRTPTLWCQLPLL